MTMTINRRPLSVHVPDRKNVAAKYYNTYKWKGIIDDLNYMAVDQDSFSDCNNVYVDEEGVLRSRPALQAEEIAIITDTGINALGDIKDIKVFNKITVYRSTYNNIEYLTFVDDSEGPYVQWTLPTSEDYEELPCKLVLADRKIFIFTPVSFDYYDIDTKEVLSAEDKIYIPITNIVVNGVESKGLSSNHLTKSYLTHYIYTNLNTANFSLFLDKEVIVTVNNVKYPITFKNNNQMVFISPKCAITSDNFTNETNYRLLGGEIGKNYPLIDVSEIGTMIISTCDVDSIDAMNKKPIINWSIYCSTDGLTFKVLPNLENIVGIPTISRNGKYVICFTESGPQIISILAEDESTFKYNTWTNLIESLDNDWYDTHFILNPSVFINDINSRGLSWNMTNQVSSYFIDDENFAFTCGTQTRSGNIDPSYPNLKVVTCSKHNNLLFKEYTLYFFENGDSSYTDTINRYTSNSNFVGMSPKIYFDPDNSDTLEVLYSFIDELTNKIYTNCFLMRSEYSSGTPSQSIDFYDILTDGSESLPICPFRSELTNAYQLFVLGDEDVIFGGNRTTLDFIMHSIGTEISSSTKKQIIFKNETDRYNNYLNFNVKVSYIDGSILTNNFLILSTKDDSTSEQFINYRGYNYEKISFVDLLFEAIPVDIYFDYHNLYPNKQITKSMYLTTKDYLYTNQDSKIEFDVLTSGDTQYFIFDHEAELAEYYFSNENNLFISSSVTELSQSDIELDGSNINIDMSDTEFKWYLPEQRKQTFDYDITNLHPISATEVAIFLPNEVRYSHWDSETSMFYYYKSKLQVGCKEGSDVITTFDGKYVIFPSERGLVAMSYQQFVATDEQTLTYLSDNIYSNFYEYLNESTSNNQIKLEKFSYYIFVYKQDSINGYVFDLRNNSWWKINNFINNTKLFVQDNQLKILAANKTFKLNKDDKNYVDFDGITKRRINWFLVSQKLYLGAINYYKTIWGLILDSTHNEKDLNSAINNLDTSYYDLRVTNYRKRVDNNIDSKLDSDKQSFDYKVTPARSFVQRCNYPLVNLFQYKLNNHFENDNVKLSIPLSLSGLTVKYKIGGEIR